MLELEPVVDVDLLEPVPEGAEVVVQGVADPDAERPGRQRLGPHQGLADRVGAEEPLGGCHPHHALSMHDQFEEREGAERPGHDLAVSADGAGARRRRSPCPPPRARRPQSETTRDAAKAHGMSRDVSRIPEAPGLTRPATIRPRTSPTATIAIPIRDQAARSRSGGRASQRIDPEPGEHRRAQGDQEERPGGDPETVHARGDRVEQGEEAELSAGREEHRRPDQDQPASRQRPVGMPDPGDHGQDQGEQADREDRLPVVVAPEVVGRASQGLRAEQLHHVRRVQVISARGPHRHPAAPEHPPLRGQVGQELDGDQPQRPGEHPGPAGTRPDRRAMPIPSPGAEGVGRRPDAQDDDEVIPLLRVSGQERHRQDRRQDQRAPSPAPSAVQVGPEGPRIPARRPDMRIMPLGRLGDHVRRELEAASSDEGRDRTGPDRA